MLLRLTLQITTWIYSNFAYTDEYKYDFPCETDETLSLHPNKYYISDYLRLL
jgi:hypothetical protein